VESVDIFQILAICGMLSPIVYTVMWILGGILQPDYSHIRDDISSLFAVKAPNKGLMQSFIIASSVLLFVFYIGLHEGINDGGGSIVGPILFLTSSVLGILVALAVSSDSFVCSISFQKRSSNQGFLALFQVVEFWSFETINLIF